MLLIPALVACGSENDDDPDSASDSSSGAPGAAAGELDEVSFSGEVGDSLTAEWSSAVEAPEETAVTTLIEGEGDAVADGDTVSTYLWIGNGTAQEEVYSDYDNGAPEAIPNDPAQLGAVFSELFDGQTYGSRVAAVATASEVFGGQEAQMGLEPTDSVVIVADLVEKQPEAPTPTDDKAHDASPDDQPTVVEENGKPTGLDFSSIEEPELDTPVQRVVLEEGTGAAVKISDTVTVKYLGSTYDADSPFDENYSSTQPLNSSLSGLIQGWSIGLTDVKVGSRVLLQIPPAFGYGAQGSGDAIPGNSTLWFVIDVVKAE